MPFRASTQKERNLVMSPTGYAKEIFGSEPTGTAASRHAILETLAKDVAIIELVRPDNPNLAHKERVKIALELARHIEPEDLDKLTFPDEIDDHTKQVNVIIDQYIEEERAIAIQDVLEQHLQIHTVNSDTGEIILMSPSQYLGIPEQQPDTPTEAVDSTMPEITPSIIEHAPLRTSLLQRALGSKGIKMVAGYIGTKVNGQHSAH